MANTYTYPHVEDYIEIIAGYRDPSGKSKQNIFLMPEPPVSLARYDVKVIESFAQQCTNGTGFTDRQSLLAVQLVLKYERQLFKLGVDISPVKVNPDFRNPIREIDRSTRAWIEDDHINMRFAYNAELIDKIRTEAKQSKGSISWNPDKKYWTADLTENNLNWIYAFLQAHNFEIANDLTTAMSLITECEKTPYNIELRARDCLSISNATESLNEYVENSLGGFDLENLLQLVDNSSTLGYTVEKVIEETVIEAYGPRFYNLCTNREVRADANNLDKLIAEIVRYAEVTNRWPIYVYEPDLSNRLTMLFMRHFNDRKQVCKLDAKETITEHTRLVYAEKIPRTPVDRIPLLVSSSGMLFGGDRQVWIQTAEKIVYFSNDVYNKNKNERTRNLCKLS
jgi:hypothetical protein